MKVLLLKCFIGITAFSLHGQVILTKAFNCPVLGDVNPKQLYDSNGVVPKSAGVNQLWDCSGFTLKTNSEVSNYIAASAAPNGSSYSGTSFVESFGQTYFYMKSSATKYEIVGIQNPNFKLNFSSNNATEFVWPVTMGYSGSDSFSGTANANNLNGSVSGNITTLANGSGTLMLPNGNVVTDVLLVKITLSATASFGFGLVKAYLTAVDYTYYDAANKFPVLTLSYIKATGAYSANSASIKINSSLVGINELNDSNSFYLFPNPAKEELRIELTNSNLEHCKVEIINVLGKVLYLEELGNAFEISGVISFSNFPSGIYNVRVTKGDKESSKKIIKE
ncbi:MAG: T9SS type A sorting domain-containing protein [Bacteroidota bacterium]